MSREEEWYKTMAEKTGKSVEELKEYRREADAQRSQLYSCLVQRNSNCRLTLRV